MVSGPVILDVFEPQLQALQAYLLITAACGSKGLILPK
jgi:hypothetical protein